jgi:hypothetical protein
LEIERRVVDLDVGVLLHEIADASECEVCARLQRCRARVEQHVAQRYYHAAIGFLRLHLGEFALRVLCIRTRDFRVLPFLFRRCSRYFGILRTRVEQHAIAIGFAFRDLLLRTHFSDARLTRLRLLSGEIRIVVDRRHRLTVLQRVFRRIERLPRRSEFAACRLRHQRILLQRLHLRARLFEAGHVLRRCRTGTEQHRNDREWNYQYALHGHFLTAR